MLRAVGHLVVVPAVLMVPVVLVIPRVIVEALHRFLCGDIAVIVVGVVVLAHHPPALVAGVLQAHDLVPGVVGVVGADAVGTVDLRYAVDGIVNIGGGFSVPVRHRRQVVVLLPLSPTFKFDINNNS